MGREKMGYNVKMHGLTRKQKMGYNVKIHGLGLVIVEGLCCEYFCQVWHKVPRYMACNTCKAETDDMGNDINVAYWPRNQRINVSDHTVYTDWLTDTASYVHHCHITGVYAK